MTEKKTIRAAIYTRKSSEECLELDFNSLDAQREACESYIKSQKHEGWILVEKEYSDGGISGGTLERPALKKLLQDIKDGLVDMIVVYKIDRLTRSLHDFSKLVDVFDKHQTSFVSITHVNFYDIHVKIDTRTSCTSQFNTSTSMGRLTLNMLLSFAQFEREVTGERIRDKKLATAKKGMWGSGGQTSFGYKVIPTNPELPSGSSLATDIHVSSAFRHRVSKKLVPHEEESIKLKRIFELYLELGSVQELMYRLENEEILTRNNKAFTAGNLYSLLKRKIYIGKIEHKGQVYEGIHDPIIDVDIFNKVQDLLANNCNSHRRRYKAEQSSLLASKLYDDNDFIMSPSHAVKKCKRYRYYISQAYLRKQKELSGSLPQVPANELEEYSLQLIKQKLLDHLKLENYNIEQYELYKQNLENYLKSWSLQNKETHFIVRAIIHKVIISHINIIYYLNPKALEDIFNLIIMKQEFLNYEVVNITDNEYEIIILPCELKRVNQGKTLIIGQQDTKQDKGMIKALKLSWEWHEILLRDEIYASELSRQLGYKTPRYVENILRLRFLSPKIQKMILTGQQKIYWTNKLLFSIKSHDWKKQERELGI
ncbi:MAG: recombinase family protein [Brevinemataceae bacterium]